MKLPPRYNHSITLAEASVLTRSFRGQATIDSPKGGMFWSDDVKRMLEQPGCVAMRYYYGREDDGTPVLILVGVDAQGKDMTTGVLLQFSMPCPPWCDAPNGLNYDKPSKLGRLVAAERNLTVTETRSQGIDIMK